MSYTIEDGTVDDWKIATDLTAEYEHWYKSYRDLETYWKAYGKENVKFLIARGTKGKFCTNFEQDREFYGCGQLANMNGNIATFSLYFVHPDHRGKGIGSAIFEKVMDEAIKNGRNIGLNAAPAMTHNYDAKAGFNKYPNWRIEVLSFQDVQAEKLNQLTATDCNILSPNEVEKAELIAYDSQIAGGIDRGDFVTSWTSHPDGYTKVALDENGKVMGYATGRIVKYDRMVVGPLYANDDDTALQLIVALFRQDKDIATRIGLFFSTTPTFQRLIAMLKEFATVKEVRYRICQFTKEVPVMDCPKVYSISDIGLGFV